MDAARLTCSLLVLSEGNDHRPRGTGAVNLPGARIGGNPQLWRGDLGNDSGPALAADGLQVGQDMFLRGGFTATGTGEVGAVRLLGARIGGSSTAAGRRWATTPAPP